MPYKTFTEQVISHLEFLRQNGLDVEALEIDAGFIRCRAIDSKEQGRGEYAYQTKKNSLGKPGLVGLGTWVRGPGGNQLKHSTYGLDGQLEGCELKPLVKKQKPEKEGISEEVEKKAQFLWDRAKETGRSDYLERKGVGSYGIRFLENQYGRVGVVPARGGTDTLRSLQFLNPDGNKRFLDGSLWSGLFHKLSKPVNGQDIGIAESYVTAASCLELSGIPVVCAFNSGNLAAVAKEIRVRYSNSRIILFADNDRHLEKNVGVIAAKKAMALAGSNSILACPDFGDIPPFKDATDWNDLIRLKGIDEAKRQISITLKINNV